MTTIKDKGAAYAAVVALIVSVMTLVSSWGARNQQLADIGQRVQQLEQQMQQFQSDLNQYLYRHDGH